MVVLKGSFYFRQCWGFLTVSTLGEGAGHERTDFSTVSDDRTNF